MTCSKKVSTEAAERYLAILPLIEAIADRGEPMPAWSDGEIAPGVRSRRAADYLEAHGHIKVLYRGTHGIQVEVVRSGKRTAGIDVLEARTLERKRIALADKYEKYQPPAVPKIVGKSRVMADAARLAAMGVNFGKKSGAAPR